MGQPVDMAFKMIGSTCTTYAGYIIQTEDIISDIFVLSVHQSLTKKLKKERREKEKKRKK